MLHALRKKKNLNFTLRKTCNKKSLLLLVLTSFKWLQVMNSFFFCVKWFFRHFSLIILPLFLATAKLYICPWLRNSIVPLLNRFCCNNSYHHNSDPNHSKASILEHMQVGRWKKFSFLNHLVANLCVKRK